MGTKIRPIPTQSLGAILGLKGRSEKKTDGRFGLPDPDLPYGVNFRQKIIMEVFKAVKLQDHHYFTDRDIFFNQTQVQ